MALISPGYEEILISVTVIIIELFVISNPLLNNCVYIFHLNTGTNFSSGPLLLLSCALEGGSITRDQSMETPLRFISFAHNLGVNHTPAIPDCQRVFCVCVHEDRLTL